MRKDPEALAAGKLQELPAKKGGYHGNMTDAVLYGWRECRGYLEEPEPTDDPEWGPLAGIERRPPTEWQKRVLAEQKRALGRDPLDALLGLE